MDVLNWSDHMYISQSAHSLGNKNDVCGNDIIFSPKKFLLEYTTSTNTLSK